MSSSRLQRTSYPVKSTIDHEGRFRGEEKVVVGPIKSVNKCKITVGPAYSQYILDHNASKSFIVTKSPVIPQELLIYPRVNSIVGPLFCLLGQEDLEPSLSYGAISVVRPSGETRELTVRPWNRRVFQKRV